jgi:hypothetical protein
LPLAAPQCKGVSSSCVAELIRYTCAYACVCHIEHILCVCHIENTFCSVHLCICMRPLTASEGTQCAYSERESARERERERERDPRTHPHLFFLALFFSRSVGDYRFTSEMHQQLYIREYVRGRVCTLENIFSGFCTKVYIYIHTRVCVCVCINIYISISENMFSASYRSWDVYFFE